MLILRKRQKNARVVLKLPTLNVKCRHPLEEILYPSLSLNKMEMDTQILFKKSTVIMLFRVVNCTLVLNTNGSIIFL